MSTISALLDEDKINVYYSSSVLFHLKLWQSIKAAFKIQFSTYYHKDIVIYLTLFLVNLCCVLKS